MSGSTISTFVTVGITLGTVTSGGTYASPLTILSTGAVDAGAGYAVLGPATQAWTVANYGTIEAVGAGGRGVDLRAGGNVSNAAATALIAGYVNGIYIVGGAGTVTNLGTIEATTARGVDLHAGGDVSNAASALITGFIGAYFLQTGTLDNLGTIEAAGTGSSGAILEAGGSVTNAADGLIGGARFGVLINGTAGVVNNSGTVISSAGTAVTLAAGGSVSNAAATALISGFLNAIYASSAAGTVDNLGVIAGTSLSGVGLAAGGYVFNAATAQISGGNWGVRVAQSAGTVVNLGTIVGGTAGSGVVLYAGGVVTNSGTAALLTGQTGLTLNGTGASTTNSGTISGTEASGDGVRLNGTNEYVANVVGAAIFGTAYGISDFAVTGTVNNLGLIAANGRFGFAVRLIEGGVVANQASGVIDAVYQAVYISGGAGTLSNLGAITGSGTQSLGVNLRGNGSVLDNGAGTAPGALIAGVLAGASMYGAGNDAANLGTIAGTGTASVGLDLVSGGTVTNGASGFSGGLIAGYRRGFFSGGAATVTNYGTIEARNSYSGSGISDGVFLDAGGIVRNASATASIAGGINGVYLGGVLGTSGTLVNSGTIVGTSGAGVRLQGASDRLVNFGTIAGVSGVGIALVGNTAQIVDYGVITGGGGTAITFGSGIDVVTVEPSSAIVGTLAGFGALETLDLATAQANASVFLGTSTAGTLTVYNGTTAVETFLVAGQSVGTGVFVVSPDGQTGVDVNLRKLFGPIVPGTYGYAIVVTGANASTTVAASGSIAAPSGDGIVNAVGIVATVTNFGTVTASAAGGDGVYLASGGVVTNISGTAGGLIAGAAIGVLLGGVGTVTNAGTIVGTSGTAVALAGGASRLVVAPGAVFGGTVAGGGGSSVLEIAGSVAVGTAAGLGAVGGQTTATYVSLGSIVGFSELQTDAGVTFAGQGTLGFAILVNDGTVDVGSTDILAIGTASGTGTIDLEQGGAIDFQGAVAGQTLTFEPPGGSAAIEQAGAFAGVLNSFTSSLDIVDLTTLAGGTLANGGSLNASDQLVVSNGAETAVLQLDTSGNYAGVLWQATPDGAGGTDVTPLCFCRGTLILTEGGEVAVEDLRVGDRVVTMSGIAKPVRWIGVGRDLVTSRHSLARPIIVSAGALADGVPSRDLYLTHGHALYFATPTLTLPEGRGHDGALIPVEHLVNHRSIRWDDAAQAVEYYHVELDGHDVLVANGAPAESYYDASNRALFHNAREGSHAGDATAPCAPVLTAGDIVERMWQRLFERAGGRIAGETTADPGLHLVADGARLDPVSAEGGVYAFALPGPPKEALHLVSRSAVPSLTGQSLRDHRRLGVALSQIVLSAPGVTVCLDHTAPLLRYGSCHTPEPGHVWTDGDLALPPALFAPVRGPATLIVHTKPQALRYPRQLAVARAA